MFVKLLAIVGIIFLFFVMGVIVFGDSPPKASLSPTAATTPQYTDPTGSPTTQTPSPATSPITIAVSTTITTPPGLLPPPTPQTPPPTGGRVEYKVTYSDSGFSPATVNIKRGDTITFVDRSVQDMWPASNPHPVHDAYPVKGGCKASTFDACQGIHPGGSWSFVFTAAGTWGYHNHLNPSHQGSIVIQ